MAASRYLDILVRIGVTMTEEVYVPIPAYPCCSDTKSHTTGVSAYLVVYHLLGPVVPLQHLEELDDI